MPEKRPRVALYSHDTYGLGHLRRSLELARALHRRSPEVDVLVVTGSPRAHSFPLPPNVNVVRLPAVSKDGSGTYVSRDADVPLEDTVRVRKRQIREAILTFRPDIFVVDHSPLGLRGELLPLLGDLRHRTGTELILGLRDILDDPTRVVADWQKNGVYRLLESIYHRVWVYGSRSVFALDELYGIPERVASEIRYLGYLGRETHPGDVPPLSASFPHPHRPHLLCLIGGGGDGFPLANAFVRMIVEGGSWNGTLVTGPFLSRAKRNRLVARATRKDSLQLLRFTSNVQRLIRGSDAVITMGGYNSLMEILSLERRALVVPRVFPRREQWIRADAFRRLGLLDTLHPDELGPESLTQHTTQLLDGPAPSTPEDQGIAWNGAQTFAEEISAIIRENASREKVFDNARSQRIRA